MSQCLMVDMRREYTYAFTPYRLRVLTHKVLTSILMDHEYSAVADEYSMSTLIYSMSTHEYFSWAVLICTHCNHEQPCCMAPFSATSSPIYGWSRPFWTSIYFPLHAQQLKGCVRYRERDLAWDRAISKWSRIHRICAEITASREIAFSASNTASKFHSVLASRIVGPNRLYVLGSRGAKLRNLNKSMTGDILIRNKRKQIKQNGQINHTKLYRACMTSYDRPDRWDGWASWAWGYAVLKIYRYFSGIYITTLLKR